MSAKGNEIRIKPMNPEDLDIILAIDRKISGLQRATTYGVDNLIEGQFDLSFIAEADDEVIGFILVSLIDSPGRGTEACAIHNIGVEPSYQRQGIATKLTQALLHESRRREIKMIRVMVDKHDTQLQGFFEYLGFGQSHHIGYSKPCNTSEWFEQPVA